MFKDMLKKLRLAQGLTQAEVAKALGVSQPNYRRWETGERAPSSDTLERLSDFFHVSTDYLLGRTDDMDKVTVYVPTDRGQKYVWNEGMFENSTKMLSYAIRNLQERIQDTIYIICELHNKINWKDFNENTDEYFTEDEFRQKLKLILHYLQSEEIVISKNVFCEWVKKYSVKKKFNNNQEILDFLERE
ncbi:helix-turn-helix transcriptional regulator [Enterococcus faecalis]|uniref:helix-turn-helix domain-containing protein n=1 Tax=Enterococcus faecalis TaxID=1351 RepID=UPI000A19E755|nr:helix-turn-helix transcriptional regulator [Enterococcus faecalis]MCO5483399.1 helix-turn-helix transcriptional regulator [Enterococcus faecalis]OSM18334.1 hypothetical protein B6S40_07930 [Enterococcus faecalis]